VAGAQRHSDGGGEQEGILMDQTCAIGENGTKFGCELRKQQHCSQCTFVHLWRWMC